VLRKLLEKRDYDRLDKLLATFSFANLKFQVCDKCFYDYTKHSVLKLSEVLVDKQRERVQRIIEKKKADEEYEALVEEMHRQFRREIGADDETKNYYIPPIK
jgi:Na+/phosphate symporter